MNIVLLGKSASGKDYNREILCNKYGYNKSISYTTRPMRSNETNHVDYHFVSEDEFMNMIKNDEFVEYRVYDTVYGKWYYGTKKENVDNTVYILDLDGYKRIKEYCNSNGIEIKGYYLECDDKIRKERAMKRDKGFNEDEWERRERDDREKWKGVKMEELGIERVKGIGER